MAVDIQRAIRRLAVLTVIMGVLMIGMGAVFVVKLSEQGDQGSRAHTAICLLRADEIQRVSAARAFIVAHPDGFAGISVASLEQTIASQERTISALTIAHCPD